MKTYSSIFQAANIACLILICFYSEAEALKEQINAAKLMRDQRLRENR